MNDVLTQVVGGLIVCAIMGAAGVVAQQLRKRRSRAVAGENSTREAAVPAPDDARMLPLAVFDVKCMASDSHQTGLWKVAAVLCPDGFVRLWGTTACERNGIRPSVSDHAKPERFAARLGVPLLVGATACRAFLRAEGLRLEPDTEILDDDADVGRRFAPQF